MFNRFMHRAYFVLMFLSLNLYSYDPSKIEQSDLETLQTFEKEAYDLTLKSPDYQDRIMKTIAYIKENSIYKEIRDTKWKVSFNAKSVAIDGKTTEESSPYRQEAGFLASYPIVDSKEEKERLKALKEREGDHIKKTIEYFDLKRELDNLKTQESFHRLKELREKVREKNAVVNFDDRLNTMKTIIELKDKIAQTQIKLIKIREDVLLLVIDNSKPDLLKLLEG